MEHFFACRHIIISASKMLCIANAIHKRTFAGTTGVADQLNYSDVMLNRIFSV